MANSSAAGRGSGASAAEIAYDMGRLEAFLGEVRRCRSVLKSEEENLNQLLQRILGPDWTGSASTAYRGYQQEWNSACTELNVSLLNLQNALQMAIENASRTNMRLTTAWSG
jgi:WXG100 family type VII secretion target